MAALSKSIAFSNDIRKPPIASQRSSRQPKLAARYVCGVKAKVTGSIWKQRSQPRSTSVLASPRARMFMLGLNGDGETYQYFC